MLTIVSYEDLKKRRNAALNEHLETRLGTANSENIALKMRTTSRRVFSLES